MDTNSYKTISVRKEDVQKDWVLVDAKNETLGRMASKVAKMLRGKHKPNYTPHVDGGDKVIIINARHVRLTGKKWTDKEYVHFSGYPGGKRTRNVKELMEKTPEKVVEKAIHGMIPKNRLGQVVKNNLFIYPGEEHPHEAQKPTKINLKEFK
ncbi:MAG: 50S ribosomal protein L13 [Bacteroidales bacterium]|nr:50S ribosomal protein L13 [Bacteroidales bacterium]